MTAKERSALFESSVILEGSKTGWDNIMSRPKFESSVILEGSKTCTRYHRRIRPFESSVILEGSKTQRGGDKLLAGV